MRKYSFEQLLSRKVIYPYALPVEAVRGAHAEIQCGCCGKPIYRTEKKPTAFIAGGNYTCSKKCAVAEAHNEMREDDEMWGAS